MAFPKKPGTNPFAGKKGKGKSKFPKKSMKGKPAMPAAPTMPTAGAMPGMPPGMMGGGRAAKPKSKR